MTKSLLNYGMILLLVFATACNGGKEKSIENQMQDDAAYFAELSCKIKARSLELPFVKDKDVNNDELYLGLVREQDSLTISFRQKYGKNPEYKKQFSALLREARKDSKYCGQIMKQYNLTEKDFRKTGKIGTEKDKE
ncbi:MAG: hypothetical protein KKD74_06415 [Bacteroidetes bacterium]|nr:hypothetical protein [Bacteroidota bacterium]